MLQIEQASAPATFYQGEAEQAALQGDDSRQQGDAPQMAEQIEKLVKKFVNLSVVYESLDEEDQHNLSFRDELLMIRSKPDDKPTDISFADQSPRLLIPTRKESSNISVIEQLSLHESVDSVIFNLAGELNSQRCQNKSDE